jgi:hypothetical protein
MASVTVDTPHPDALVALHSWEDLFPYLEESEQVELERLLQKHGPAAKGAGITIPAARRTANRFIYANLRYSLSMDEGYEIAWDKVEDRINHIGKLR